MSDTPPSPEEWSAWLPTFREQYIEAQGWSAKEANRCIRDAWAVVRDGRVCVLTKNSQRPADAMPVFEKRTPGGWKPPIEIIDRLTGVIGKAMTSQRPPRDIVMGLLDLANHADGQEESDEIKQKRDKAAFWVWQLLDACEDKALAGVIGGDIFWQVPLSAYQAGYHYAILERYRDQTLLADLIKAQAFQSGRKPDELSRRLETNFRGLHAKRGQLPRPREVAEAAGGKWSETDACWQFGKQLVSHGALCQRLKAIRHKHST